MKTNVNSGLVIVSVLVLLALRGPARAIESGEQIQDMISHWKFDEAQGSIAYDSAGNNDGTIYGAVWTTGQIDGALSFDGVDDYVDVGNDSSLKPPLPVTLSAWIRLSSLGSPQVFVALDDRSIGRYGTAFFVMHENNLQTSYADGGSPGPASRRTKVGATALSANTWYHVAAVLRGPTDMDIYINGVDDGGTYSGTGGSLTYSASGHSFIGNDAGVRSYFNGKIDDVRIYNVALSPEEIWQLYQPTLPNVVALDIKPQSCPNPLNLKSRGVLPVAVLGSEDFDVNNIDVASIRLADVAPIRSSFDDVATPVADGNECECTAEGPDGYTDLTLKFKTQEIVEKLINAPNELVGGQTLSLTLTGALSDDTLIEGTDCVLLVGNVPRAIAATRADINGDGVVDFRDLTIVSNYWLESSEIE